MKIAWIFKYSSSVYTLTHSRTNVRMYIHTNKFGTNECPNIFVKEKLIQMNVRINICDQYIRMFKFSNIFVTLYTWCILYSNIDNTFLISFHWWCCMCSILLCSYSTFDDAHIQLMMIILWKFYGTSIDATPMLWYRHRSTPPLAIPPITSPSPHTFHIISSQ